MELLLCGMHEKIYTWDMFSYEHMYRFGSKMVSRQFSNDTFLRHKGIEKFCVIYLYKNDISIVS